MGSPQVNIEGTYGTAFVGLLVSAILYGITLLQTFFYFRHYPQDTCSTKSLVLCLWLFDTLQLILSSKCIYWHLVERFGDYDALHKLSWAFDIQANFAGLVGSIVQCFFARRVWKISRNPWLTGPVVFFACVYFGLATVFTVYSFILVDTSKLAQLVWVTSTGLGSGVLADSIVAGSLCYYLARNRTGFTKTDSLITTLIIYSMTTGLLTCILAMTTVITFAVNPSHFLWLAMGWALEKCYVNSLLAALNSRDSLRSQIARRDTSFLQMSGVSPLSGSLMESPSSSLQRRRGLMAGIRVDTGSKIRFNDQKSSLTPPPSALCSPV